MDATPYRLEGSKRTSGSILIQVTTTSLSTLKMQHVEIQFSVGIRSQEVWQLHYLTQQGFEVVIIGSSQSAQDQHTGWVINEWARDTGL